MCLYRRENFIQKLFSSSENCKKQDLRTFNEYVLRMLGEVY